MSELKNAAHFAGNTSGFGWSQGLFSRQPHVDVPAGTFEEEHGRQGFFGRATHLYHRHPPTGWLRIEGELKPRAYFATRVQPEEQGLPEFLLENADVRVGIAKISEPMKIFVRNSDGDEIRFVDQGAGDLQTDYGDIAYRTGDYLLIPRGTTYRFVPKEPTVQFVIESYSEVHLPEKGLLGRHAFFDPMVMRTPVLPSEERTDGLDLNGEYQLRVKRQSQWTKIFYPWNPLDAVGWKGDLVPWALNIDDMRPVVSAGVLLPPSAYTTFLGSGFIVCSFLPRPAVQDPKAERVPFYHRNSDYDEILFHHLGKFSARSDIGAGRIVWHPQGIHHGPHPTSASNACKIKVEEVAVMVDTSLPLKPMAAALPLEDPSYAMSWSADQKR
jgi:homogentisate 1,2-dioxygenase